MTPEVARLNGPPGTGKTWTLAHAWVPRAVERFGETGVVCLSLTRAAARELGSRVDLPETSVGTLHALCFRALNSPNVAAGKAIARWNERAAPVYALSGDTQSQDDLLAGQASASRGDDLLASVDVCRHRMEPEPPTLQAFRTRWDDWLRDENLIDFTGLLEQVLDQGLPCPGQPAALFVDEAQDCSLLELEVVKLWARDAQLVVLAGDAMQSIYGWRGATGGAFEAFPAGKEVDLGQSYRLAPAVHAAACRVGRRVQGVRFVEFKPREGTEGSTGIGPPCDQPRAVAAAAVQEIDWGRTAMLLASAGYMLQPYLGALRDMGIPYWNPWRLKDGRWNPLSKTAAILAMFLAPAHQPRGWTWEEIAAWRKLIKSTGVFKRGTLHLIDERGEGSQRGHEVDVSSAADVFCDGVYQQLEGLMDEGGNAMVDWLLERVIASKARAIQYPARVYRSSGIEALTAEPQLIVGTIHSVKGGEADAVLISPEVSDAAFKESRREGQDALWKLFYVGVTRARDRLVMLGRSQRRRCIAW